MGRHQLSIHLGRSAHRFALPDDGSVILGSQRQNDIVIAHATVSRQHARIGTDAEGAWVEDLGSRNGTQVDRQALSKGQRVRLTPGSSLQFGQVSARLLVLEPGDDSLAVALDAATHGGGRDDPGTLPGEAGATAFWTRALPDLLARAHAGATGFELACALGEAMREHLPMAGLRIDRLTADGEETPIVLAMDAGAGSEVSFEVGTYCFVFTLAVGADPRAVLALAPMCAAVIAFGRDRPVPAPPRRELAPPFTLDPRLRSIYTQAACAANSELHVLIRGESGTGKELFARYLHRASGRADDRFVAINCAALPESLLEAELFGVEKGIATGVEARAGVFERADEGTLFLDEIGDMSLATQTRILRVLQQREVFRLGAGRARPARVRVISATHQPLEELVERGLFRRDLWHRIADWEVRLPPLRERVVDVPSLASRFLAAAAAERGLHIKGITRRALDALMQYSWPGNVRELEREMQRVAVFLDQDAALRSADLRPDIRAQQATPYEHQDASLEAQLAHAERAIIERALAAHDQDVGRAATALGVPRATLYRRMAAWSQG